MRPLHCIARDDVGVTRDGMRERERDKDGKRASECVKPCTADVLQIPREPVADQYRINLLHLSREALLQFPQSVHVVVMYVCVSMESEQKQSGDRKDRGRGGKMKEAEEDRSSTEIDNSGQKESCSGGSAGAAARWLKLRVEAEC
ncbi:unnamed protein product [Pleuronectes platessa]|uniref:Uncharacterized protein n=1 Tax=Pleuronectes platessa TaxID=8262 RepID=A0A9N7Z4U5_PLEPL|nr:unnamed protein product [Pleuronectes platessa]